jgi:hypothetical protein
MTWKQTYNDEGMPAGVNVVHLGINVISVYFDVVTLLSQNLEDCRMVDILGSIVCFSIEDDKRLSRSSSFDSFSMSPSTTVKKD